MNHNLPKDTALQDLAGELAELETRLRLFLSHPAVEAETWPVLSSLQVRNDLLAGLAEEADHGGLIALTDALGALLTAGRDRPKVLPGALEPFLLELDDSYRRTLLALDGGQDLEQALAHPAWEWLCLRLRHLDTPLEVFAELHATLGRWQERWCDGDLPPEVEADIGRRWAILRDFADALFSPESEQDKEGHGPTSLLRWTGFGGED